MILPLAVCGGTGLFKQYKQQSAIAKTEETKTLEWSRLESLPILDTVMTLTQMGKENRKLDYEGVPIQCKTCKLSLYITNDYPNYAAFTAADLMRDFLERDKKHPTMSIINDDKSMVAVSIAPTNTMPNENYILFLYWKKDKDLILFHFRLETKKDTPIDQVKQLYQSWPKLINDFVDLVKNGSIPIPN
jgi:hypothetical protein